MKETVHGSPEFGTYVFLRVALCSPVQVHFACCLISHNDSNFEN